VVQGAVAAPWLKKAVMIAAASRPNARWSAVKKSERLSEDQYNRIKSAFAVCYILWRL
jgi:hypothetical protein